MSKGVLLQYAVFRLMLCILILRPSTSIRLSETYWVQVNCNRSQVQCSSAELRLSALSAGALRTR